MLKHSDYTYRYVGKTGRSKGIEYMQQRVKYTKRTEVNTLQAESTRRWNRSEQVILRLQELQTWRHVCDSRSVGRSRPSEGTLSTWWRASVRCSSCCQRDDGSSKRLAVQAKVWASLELEQDRSYLKLGLLQLLFFLQLQLNHGEDGE